MSGKDLSLYIHIPFCVSKCRYCDFLSAPAGETEKEAYVQALCRQIRAFAADYRDYRIRTVFLGGGTPTILTVQQLERIMTAVRESFPQFCEEAEISIECNPGTADYQNFKAMLAMGINRLSIGLQSADDAELKYLGRIHTWESFQKSYAQAREAGFRNMNIDLMSALPGQTIASYEKTLRKVIRLQPEHISAYSLIIEEGTPFYRIYQQEQAGGYPELPDEDEERSMYMMTEKLLSEAGYHRYEISNYAKEGMECRHNCVYWQRGNYLGLGLGASSMVENRRWKNTDEIRLFLQDDFEKKEPDDLSLKEQMEEYMFLGLRLMRGIAPEEFEACFACRFAEVYGETADRLEREGLLEENGGRIRLTGRGIDVSNRVLAEFLLS